MIEHENATDAWTGRVNAKGAGLLKVVKVLDHLDADVAIADGAVDGLEQVLDETGPLEGVLAPRQHELVLVAVHVLLAQLTPGRPQPSLHIFLSEQSELLPSQRHLLQEDPVVAYEVVLVEVRRVQVPVNVVHR